MRNVIPSEAMRCEVGQGELSLLRERVSLSDPLLVHAELFTSIDTVKQLW